MFSIESKKSLILLLFSIESKKIINKNNNNIKDFLDSIENNNFNNVTINNYDDLIQKKDLININKTINTSKNLDCNEQEIIEYFENISNIKIINLSLIDLSNSLYLNILKLIKEHIYDNLDPLIIEWKELKISKIKDEFFNNNRTCNRNLSLFNKNLNKNIILYSEEITSKYKKFIIDNINNIIKDKYVNVSFDKPLELKYKDEIVIFTKKCKFKIFLIDKF